MLLYTAIVSPFRIAFYDVDSIEWVCVDSFVDFTFTIDIICNFFTAYFDSDDDLILQRSVIAKNYLKGWFLIDLISVFPVNLILETKDYAALTRIARLPKLYRLIKIAKYLF